MAVPQIRADGSVNGPGPVIDQDRSDFEIGETVTFVDTEAANALATHNWQIVEAPTGSSNVLGTPTVASSTLVLDATGTWIISDTVGSDIQTIRIAVRLPKTNARTPAYGEKGQWDEGGLGEGWHPAREELDRNLDNLLITYGRRTLAVNESHDSATPLIVGQFQFNPNDFNTDATKLELRFRALAINGASGLTTHVQLYNLTDSEIVADLSFTDETQVVSKAAVLTIGAAVSNIKQASKIYEVLIFVDAPSGPTDTIELGSVEFEVHTVY